MIKAIAYLTLPIRFVLAVAFLLASSFVGVIMTLFIALMFPTGLPGFLGGWLEMLQDVYDWTRGVD